MVLNAFWLGYCLDRFARELTRHTAVSDNRDFKQTTTTTATKTGKTKGLMSRTMALHVHYKTLCISQPFSAKQQREITTLCVFKTT